MGDGTEFQDDDEGVDWSLDEELEERPLIFTMLSDPRKKMKGAPPDAIWNLVDEAFDPNPLRSHVVTLHLYLEYWLDKLLALHGVKDDLTFAKKVKRLKDLGSLDDDTETNLVAINRLRNVYAHELDLAKADARVENLLSTLRNDPYFESTDKDPLRTVCFQTMFTLDATLANAGKPPALEPFPYEDVRKTLLATGEVHWGECELLAKEAHGHEVEYTLRCPLCHTGTIQREKDNTPGFKDATIWPCSNCGLRGDWSTLELETARAEFRP